MFDVVVDKNDLKQVDKFLESGILVREMNNAGLSIGAMALVLTAIEQECSRILDEMNKEEENE